MSDAMALPLAMLGPNTEARVARIHEGGRGITHKLSAMGILPGALVSVAGNPGGPLLCHVGDTRVAVGRGMAQRIMVVPCTEQGE